MNVSEHKVNDEEFVVSYQKTNNEILFVSFDDEIPVFRIKGALAQYLNLVFNENMSAQHAHDTVLSEYDVTQSVLDSDIDKMLGELLNKKILVTK